MNNWQPATTSADPLHSLLVGTNFATGTLHVRDKDQLCLLAPTADLTAPLGSTNRRRMSAAAAAAAPTVEKSAPELVQPAGPTPGGTLPLSAIDKTAAARVWVVLVQVFPQAAGDVVGGQDAAVAAMRDGFARALVPY